MKIRKNFAKAGPKRLKWLTEVRAGLDPASDEVHMWEMMECTFEGYKIDKRALRKRHGRRTRKGDLNAVHEGNEWINK